MTTKQITLFNEEIIFATSGDISQLKTELDELTESHGKVRRGVMKSLKEMTDELEALKSMIKVNIEVN